MSARNRIAVAAVFLFLAACAGGTSDSAGSNPTPAATQTTPPPPATDTLTPAIPGVVAAGTVVKLIQEGFNGTEGPVAHPDGQFLFTETRANRINRIDSDGKVSSFMENTNGSNALAFDKQGKLYSVQTTPGRMQVGIIQPSGSEQVLAADFEGKPFARPNDMVLASNGAIYFTDFSILDPVPAGTLPPTVYYIAPGSGKAVAAATGIERPNGIQLSRDEKILFVNNMWGEHLLAFDIGADGMPGNRRNFAAYHGVKRDSSGAVNSGADGLAIDGEGRVYAATLAGVQIFSATGELLGVIPMPRAPQNVAFAGPGKKMLYIVGQGAVWRVETLTSGFGGRAK
jgi:gluconolactonase